MLTIRIEFMDGQVSFVEFSLTEPGPNDKPRMFAWEPVEEGLMLKAHKLTNRVIYPWANIRSYSLHLDEDPPTYRSGAIPYGKGTTPGE